jgi:hypothetical protein
VIGGAATSAEAEERFADRIFGAAAGMAEILSVYIGDRLGFYRELAQRGPMTIRTLAVATGTDRRRVHEWCEQQVAGGILAVTAPGDRAQPRYALPHAHREVLVSEQGLVAMTWLPRLMVAGAHALPAMIAAFTSDCASSNER